MEPLFGIVREGLVVASILCLPVLALATITGLAVAVFQAATQIQEQTLTLLPKMLAVAAALALLGPFALRLCAGLFSDAIVAIPAIVAGGS